MMLGQGGMLIIKVKVYALNVGKWRTQIAYAPKIFESGIRKYLGLNSKWKIIYEV